MKKDIFAQQRQDIVNVFRSREAVLGRGLAIREGGPGSGRRPGFGKGPAQASKRVPLGKKPGFAQRFADLEKRVAARTGDAVHARNSAVFHLDKDARAKKIPAAAMKDRVAQVAQAQHMADKYHNRLAKVRAMRPPSYETNPKWRVAPARRIPGHK